MNLCVHSPKPHVPESRLWTPNAVGIPGRTSVSMSRKTARSMPDASPRKVQSLWSSEHGCCKVQADSQILSEMIRLARTRHTIVDRQPLDHKVGAFAPHRRPGWSLPFPPKDVPSEEMICGCVQDWDLTALFNAELYRGNSVINVGRSAEETRS